MIYASFPEHWPIDWGHPGTGQSRLIRMFYGWDEANSWREDGCPGILRPLNGYAPGWNRVTASPRYFWLDEVAARALEWEDQQRKFDWCRQNVTLSEERPPLPVHPDQVLYTEKILLFPGYEALARAHFLRAYTETGYPKTGLDVR